MKSWKCYRCDLTFKQEQHAVIHHDITNHPFNQIGAQILVFTAPLVCIENVVATANIDQILDLHEIKRKFPNSSYDPQQFLGVVFKIDLPKTTTLIFRTGNMVYTGAKSEKHAYTALNNVVKQLRSKNIKIKNDANILGDYQLFTPNT